MNKRFYFLVGVALVLLATVAGNAQAALTSTTLSAAITDTSSRVIQVASASGFSAGTSFAYVDRELLDVRAVSGTVISVVRGAAGTRAMTHASGATIYVGSPNYFSNYARYGTCTRANEVALPVINVQSGIQYDCFASTWQQFDNFSRYDFDVAPNAQPSAASPTAGNALSISGQAGGAQSATSSNGAAGGAIALAAGAGGAGGSASGTGGAGGGASLIGGAGGGTVTGGAGGLASIGGGAGANGSGAGGTGGGLNLYSGAKGTGGTGTDGAVNIRQGGAAGSAVLSVSTAGKETVSSVGTNQDLLLSPSGSGVVSISDGTDPTKKLSINVASGSTAVATTFSLAATSARSVVFPDVSLTVIPVMNHSATAVNASTLHIVRDTCVLGTSCAVTFTGTAVWADTNYVCNAQDVTAAAATKFVATSTSVATFTGTGTDTLVYTCIGN